MLRINKNNNLFYIDLFFLTSFLLIPFGFVIGPFFLNLFVSIFSLIFIYMLINEKKLFYFRNNFFYLFVIFFIYIIITSLFSNDVFLSLSSSLFYFRYYIFALGIAYAINEYTFFIFYIFIYFINRFHNSIFF